MPTGKASPDEKLLVTEGEEVQLSVAVGAVQVAIALVPEVDKLMFCGQLAKIGGVISFKQGSKALTTILNWHCAVLFAASRAV